MRSLVILVLVGSALAAKNKEHNVPILDGKIVGGSLVDINEYPYEVAILYSASHVCAGSIISPNWVVTAAHCADERWTSSFQIRAGSNHPHRDGSRHSVTHIIKHSSYDSSSLDYDIALMHVNKVFKVGTAGIDTVALPEEGKNSPDAGLLAAVSGWGTLDGESITKLEAVQVPILNKQDCKTSYGNNTITDRMLCAGYATIDNNVCIGDSGSPLVIDGVLVGFASWGTGCAAVGSPNVYTDVGVLRSWIKEKSGV